MNENLTIAATLAANIKKASKANTFDTIVDLIRSGVIKGNDAAMLYGYFLPAAPKVSKSAFEWVAKSIAGKNDVRWYLRYVYSKDGRMVGTDGHRMHIAPTDLPDGLYDTQGALVDDPENYASYPNIDKVMPADNGVHESVVLSDCEVRPIAEGASMQVIELIDGCWFNLQYVRDAAAGETAVTILNGDSVSPKSAVLLRCKFGLAVIMPVRIQQTSKKGERK